MYNFFSNGMLVLWWISWYIEFSDTSVKVGPYKWLICYWLIETKCCDTVAVLSFSTKLIYCSFLWFPKKFHEVKPWHACLESVEHSFDQTFLHTCEISKNIFKAQTFSQNARRALHINFVFSRREDRLTANCLDSSMNLYNV